MSELSTRLASLSPAKRQLLEQRLQQKKAEVAEPIAIVGMSCRFAGVRSLDDYRRLIFSGTDATGEIPKNRWDLDEFYDPTGEQNGKMSVRWGGFISDVEYFDPMFFGITPREARKMDPQQRLLLECAWEAFEHAGLAPEQMCGTSTGVFVGIGGMDYSKCAIGTDTYFEQIDAHSGTGNALSIAANRISYILDLKGPSMAIDTACSSGLIGVHLAVHAIRNRECDMALAGAVNLILTPETTIAFSRAKMLSPEGKCRPFDSRSNGYVRGEGCAMVALKRLTDAVRDGDRVLAVVRGSATNQDGRTSGITAPSGMAQQQCIKAALADGGLTPDRVSYIEAHGTGTPLGDPIEVQALGEVFKRRSPDDSPVLVTSVKSNIGHTETVSGVAGLVKAVLLLEAGKIPPQCHLEKLNPNMTLDGSRLQIPTSETEWKPAGPTRVAGVSSFGFGGANVHVVIEEAAHPAEANLVSEATPDRPQHLLTLSAKSDTALRKQAEQLGAFLEANPGLAPADVAFSENTGRSHFNNRAAIIAESADGLRSQLKSLAEGKSAPGVKIGQVKIATRPKVAFHFTGQGSQYVGMGRGLYDSQPVFRETLNKCDEILNEYLDQSLLSIIFPEAGRESPLDETIYTQPALFALEYSLATLWRSWGIEPSVVLGHSVGEYVAACIAGVFSLEDGLKLISDRARLMQQLPQDGLMAVIFAGPDRVGAAVARFAKVVSIAAANGPENTVISGRADVVRELVAKFTADGVGSQMLTVSHAFHSPLMEPMLDEFVQLAGEVNFSRPRIPLITNFTNEVLTDRPLDPTYLRNHIRGTVRFADNIHTLAEFGVNAVVEVGPTASLTGMARRCQPKTDAIWVPTLRKGQDDSRTVLSSLSDLYVLGVKVNWREFDKPWPRRRLALPTYPFERARHWWDEATAAKKSSSTAARGPSLHPLLGCRIPTAVETTLFEVRFSSRSPRYMIDHNVQGSAVVPGAAYIEQGLAAAELVFGPGQHAVENVAIQQAMFLPEDGARLVQITVSPEMGGECTYETYSVPADAEPGTAKWTMHASGKLRHEKSRQMETPPAIDLDEVRSRTVDVSDRETFYEQIAKRGLVYGPCFRVLSDLRRTKTDALAEVALPDEVKKELGQYHLHPALLDALMQSMAGAVPLEPDGSYSPYTYMPVGVKRVSVFGPLTEKMFTYAVRTSPGDRPSPETVEGNVYLLDETGRVLVELQGVRVHRVGRAAHGDAEFDLHDWMYKIGWVEQPLGAESSKPQPLADESWLVLADASGVGLELAKQLESCGAKCVVVTSSQLDPLSGDAYSKLFTESFGAEKAKCNGIVHGWSLDVPDDDSLNAARRLSTGSALQLIRQMVRHGFAKQPALWLVTRGVVNGTKGTNENCPASVAQASLWGLGRVAAMEMTDSRCRLVDLDPTQSAADAAAILATDLAAAPDEDQIAYRGAKRLVARLEAAPEALPADDEGKKLPIGQPFRLRIGKTGSFDSLKFEAFQRLTPGKGQIEIAVHAAGLNFSDVLKAMGLYPGITDAIVPLGIECSGVVTAVGEGVTRFQVGDEVMGVAPYSFASHAITADYAIVKKPRSIDDAEAATIPITFLTAYYGLLRLAHIVPGERVLIHAGAGGVGLAAIQICQHLGCEVFCTAGSDAKRDYLRSLGVKHVLNSRTTDFAEEILRLTNREGVDVVLNSLPGDAIPKSLGILRAYGRFLEIGKTDIYQNKMIGLLPFQDNLSYHAIDLDRMLRQRPDYIRAMFEEMMTFFENGTYRPLPLTEFPIEDVTGAFRYMAQRKNIGKVVCSLPVGSGPCSEFSEQTEQKKAFTGTCLITGGLGALGLEVANWLASKGAKHLALMSRRGATGEAADAVAKLTASGVHVAVVQGDAADWASLDAALAQIPADFPPLQGVIHAAGVLDDGMLFDMTLERLDKAMKPKVDGGWNLHWATRERPLDYFVLFSSVAAVFGSPGQSNYAAGNAFLDGLAQYRRSLGLPATSINWGPWAGSGMAADANVAEQVKAKGMGLLPVEQGLKALEGLLRGPAANVAVMDARWADMSRLMSKRQPPLLRSFLSAAGESATTDSKVDHALRAELLAASPDDRKVKLRDYFRDELARIMSIDPSTLNLTQPLNTIGLDSLMAMELKNNIEGKLAISLPMQKFLEGPSVTTLADTAAELIAGDEPPAAPAEATADTPIAKPLGVPPTNGNGKKNGNGHVWTPLITLQAHGSLPPLFCIHPAGGDVQCYYEMARNISDRPVFALRARGMDEHTAAHESVEQLATEYLAAIRATSPSGPYHIAGWSTGGIFAYELARQLHAAGTPAASLIFFDSPLPSILKRADLNDDARFLFDLVNFSNYFAGANMKVNYEMLAALDAKSRLELALAQAKAQGVVPQTASTDHIRRLINVCKSHVRALLAYEPRPFGQTVHLFRPRVTAVLDEASGQEQSVDLGWKSILGSGLQIHRVAGDHFSMMTGERGQALAGELARCLG